MSVQDQEQIDSLLAELDGTQDFSNLGTNVCWPVSAVCCLAGAANQKCPLWKYLAKLADTRKCSIPVPLISVFTGGALAQNH